MVPNDDRRDWHFSLALDAKKRVGWPNLYESII